MNTRSFTWLVVAIFAATSHPAEARFFGNLPETVPPDQAQQSHELGGQALAVVARVYAGLAEYERKGDVQAINTVIHESQGVFNDLFERYRQLANTVEAVRVNPDESARKSPSIKAILEFYKQPLNELSNLSAITMKMAQEEQRVSTQLSNIKFTGSDDHQTVVELYDALDRLIYLAAVYAAINRTASH